MQSFLVQMAAPSGPSAPMRALDEAQSLSPLVEAVALTHRFPNGVTLEFPDFALRRGQAVLLRGPSGAGKSTLLHLLAGVLAPAPASAPDSARLSLGDIDLLQASAKQRRALRPDRVGWVPQRPILQAGLSLLDNLLLPVLFSTVPLPGDMHARAIHALDRLGLGQSMHQRGREASVGQAARVNLARALLLRPMLLLADEPTAALDTESAERVAKVVAEYLEAGGSAVIATHDEAWTAVLEHAAPGATRVLELRGRA
ncbi:MAG: ATP-binding cassette domain-containing protein [Casimicrobiaceae bacterium]